MMKTSHNRDEAVFSKQIGMLFLFSLLSSMLCNYIIFLMAYFVPGNAEGTEESVCLLFSPSLALQIFSALGFAVILFICLFAVDICTGNCLQFLSFSHFSCLALNCSCLVFF